MTHSSSSVLGRVAVALGCFVTALHSLTYYYGDGSYFNGTVDSMGRPRQGELYTENQQLRYNGSFKEGLFHGEGVWAGQGGHRYTGQFMYGKAAGWGVWVTGRGERIEGQFQNHTVNGEATWSWPREGTRMVGVFKRGYAHGPGTLYFQDGSRFVGTFKKGYPNGPSQVISANNSLIWAGNFTNGALDGEVGENLEEKFTHFHNYPLRMRRSSREDFR